MLLALVSTHSYAAKMEFDEAQEIKCNEEAKVLNCLNAKGEDDQKCLTSKKAQLTPDCQELHTTKSKNM